MSMARKTQNLLNNISFQNEAMCKSFFVKMSFICMRIKYQFLYQ